MTRISVMALMLLLAACSGGGTITAPAAAPSLPSVGDPRPAVLALVVASKSTDGKWFVFADLPVSRRYAHLPCTMANGSTTDIGMPIAGIFAAQDTLAMPAGNFDLTSSDTTVIAYTQSRSLGQLSVTIKRAGTTTVTARYRDGLTVTHTVVIGDAFFAGAGACYANE